MPNLIPQPEKLTVGQGVFALTRDTILVADGDDEKIEARKFAAAIAPATGFKLRIKSEVKQEQAIVFSLDPNATTGDEGYRLTVGPQAVKIVAAKPAGLFYASQTLRQLLPPAVYALSPQEQVAWEIPAVSIEDAPRFKWRGMMLDCGRHFFSVEEVKKFIDTMSMHKFNTFHWHLTDDQGWRLEIKKYPRLTEFGSIRTESPSPDGKGDGKPYGGFYTQRQAREIVAYAAQRHITVLPEIEMPGHASAAIASYPMLGNSDIPGYAPKVATTWNIFPYIFAPKDETFVFIENVLREVLDIFPSSYIHVGGDEAPKAQWEQSAIAREVMAKNHLKDAHELQSYFVQRVEKFLNANGRNLIGWDEILQGGLAPNAAVMSWRGEAGAAAATNLDHPVVMASYNAYYFDYLQSKAPSEPRGFNAYLPLHRVYAFEPTASLEADKRHLLLGPQGQVWTEYISTFSRVEYMAQPRASALAETAWSPAENKNYSDFLHRLQTHLTRLRFAGINFRPLTAEATPAGTWKSGQLSETWMPTEWDITPFINKRGMVEATFQYTTGTHRLDIASSELLCDGHVVSRDEHTGTTGGSTRNNVYHLKLPSFTAGAKYSLRAQVRTDEGNDSNGEIYITTR